MEKINIITILILLVVLKPPTNPPPYSPLLLCSSATLLLCSSAPLLLCSSAPLLFCYSAPLLLCSSAPLLLCSSAPLTHWSTQVEVERRGKKWHRRDMGVQKECKSTLAVTRTNFSTSITTSQCDVTDNAS